MPPLRALLRCQSRFGIPTLEGKRCFITGAASGIGRATAVAAARQGPELFLTDVNEGQLATAVTAIRRHGGKVSAWRALDVADYRAVRAFAEDIHRQHGAMDLVMNIAGISVWGKVEDMRHEHWQKVVDINLMGPIHVIETFLPAMIRAGRGGYLVNVSSAAGLFGLPWHAAYSASKFGLRGVSEVLRFDLARHRIGVSLVCPGRVATPLVRTAEILGVDRRAPEFEEMKEDFWRRAVTPERAAAAILRGVHRGEYLVFTSNDIRLAHWLQQKFPFIYEHGMRSLNLQMQDLAERANGSIPEDRAHNSPDGLHSRPSSTETADQRDAQR